MIPNKIKIEIETTTEYWTEITLKDGTVLQMKIIPTEVFKLENIYDDIGRPVYNINFQTVNSIKSCPIELMRKPN